MGRSRSKARYSLANSSDVADLLEAVVDQGIHNKPPPKPASIDESLDGSRHGAGSCFDTESLANSLSSGMFNRGTLNHDIMRG